ncbi:alpha/beta hydrolase [Methylobacterium radiodurans]|uniref:alpha/beta hydrolase n=1 Tax=Methylobacterium radiodurans TaxID=2202828 RepID=UPI001FE8D0CA|nr:alpha/beta hydrolase [Methylobacterium radiodurans]
MPKSIGFTPPLLSVREALPVRRRVLFYVHGYDPEADRRYRALFMRELRLYAKRFGIAFPRVSRTALDPSGTVQTWTVEHEGEAGRVTTTYNVLLWHDLVRADMARPYLVGACLNVLAFLHVALSGALFRMYRASWKCGNVILYPTLVAGMLPCLAIGLGLLAAGLIEAGLIGPAWLAPVFGAACGILALRLVIPRLDRTFLWQLMNDWVFAWQQAMGRRADYQTRLDTFADLICTEIRSADADEVMLVGHSSGALTAVEIAARVLQRDDALGREGSILSLLTLGSSLPIVAMQPAAAPIRAAIASLLTSQRLVWVDYQAPQDWMNFPGFEPARDLRLRVPPLQATNPIVRSAKFRDIIDTQTYERIKKHPFRMHFQFLMANEFPGVFDIFALTLGDQRMPDRVLDENAAPLRSPEARVVAAIPAGGLDAPAAEPVLP